MKKIFSIILLNLFTIFIYNCGSGEGNKVASEKARADSIKAVADTNKGIKEPIGQNNNKQQNVVIPLNNTTQPTVNNSQNNNIPKKSTSHMRVGCICRDGSHSNATGRGACSHHGGVDHWLYDDDK